MCVDLNSIVKECFSQKTGSENAKGPRAHSRGLENEKLRTNKKN